MSIGVQSYPELYTMLIGWNLYDQLWAVLSQTGLAYLPFLGIVLRNIIKPYESQEAKDAASTSLRRMEVEIVGTLLLIFLGVAPFMPLDVTKVNYTPVCQAGGANNTFQPGNTGTTWDTAFAVPSGNIQVPLWWYAVISVSEGFASSATTMVGCPPDLRGMVTQVDMAQITDPELKEQLQQFETNCYMPARTQFMQDAQDNAGTMNTINNDRSQYGSDDTEWLGSHAFQDTYYQSMPQTQMVKGFAYTPANDINADTDQANPPAYGNPTCSQWWNDPQNGLKTRLNAVLPQHFWNSFQSYINNTSAQDGVIKKLLNNAGSTGYQGASNPSQDGADGAIMGSIGIWFEQLTTYPKLYAAAQSAPIIQALLLMMIYTFLPFALVFSGYKPATFITGAIIIFSVIFWSFIWHLVSYADSVLMSSLYNPNNFFETLNPNDALVDMITGTLVIVAPLFWFVFMGSMGIAIGGLVSTAFTSLSQTGDNAGAKGGAIAQTAAKAATKI